jgi:prepilin-type N-terminal cleavage/methylation domain-containing protein
MMRGGFTLLEIMIVLLIMGVVMTSLFTLAMSLERSTTAEDARISALGQVNGGITGITRQLREASMGSLVLNGDPSVTIQYQVPADLDGNGVVVDQDGFLELSVSRMITRDVDDLNGDRITQTQLVMTDNVNDPANAQVTVLANNLLIDEDLNNNNVLDAGEDTNFNNRLDRGLLFESGAGGIRVTLQAQIQSSPTSQPTRAEIVNFVFPRN